MKNTTKAIRYLLGLALFINTNTNTKAGTNNPVAPEKIISNLQVIEKWTTKKPDMKVDKEVSKKVLPYQINSVEQWTKAPPTTQEQETKELAKEEVKYFLNNPNTAPKITKILEEIKRLKIESGLKDPLEKNLISPQP